MNGSEVTRLRRTLGTADGLAMVVGIAVGSGIFRTPGLVAAQLGRTSLAALALVVVLASLNGNLFVTLRDACS